jgi:hypothetical protein
MPNCPVCGSQVQAGAQYCPACGTNLQQGYGAQSSQTSSYSQYPSKPHSHKIRTIILVVVVVVIIGIAALFVASLFLAPSTTAACTSPWNCATGYPLQYDGTYAVAGQACVSNTTYIYCIGGVDSHGEPHNNVYYSSTVSGNITSWTLYPYQYPQSINGQSCVISSNYVYCVGGTYDDNFDDTALSYYAQINETGALGNWSPTTSYPIAIDTQSCVASSSLIYCVGGYNETGGTSSESTMSSSVWYAQLSSSGISSWTLTTSYPSNVYIPVCSAANSYIYCVGGADINDNSLNTVYYAELTGTGVGAWSQTTSYPVSESGQACVASSENIYCVAGVTAEGSSSSSPSYTNAVYYAPVSSGGVGTWKQAANYPISVETTCAVSSGNLYCVGGFDGSSAGENNAVDYASLVSLAS